MYILSVEKLAFLSGLLGNIISFMVFLAPVPTFYSIWKKKSSDGFQSIPYVVALFSASMLLYYAALKGNAYLIVSINVVGCVIETVYLVLFITYASKEAKGLTYKMVLIFNFGFLGVIILSTIILAKGPNRVTFVGWICAVINVAVFAAPLSIMRQVIRTKSVEFMPFTLSLFLTLCATTWFFFGFFTKDYFIAFPNVLGFLFGIIQMILYLIYRNVKNTCDQDHNIKEVETKKDQVDIEINKV